VHQAAIDVLGPVVNPSTVHQAKFSMGTVLGMIATFRRAGLAEFQQHFRDPRVVALRDRVRMVQDEDVEAAYPQRWIGKVDVVIRDGRMLAARVEEPRGDPGNTLSRSEIEDKAVRLAEWSGAAMATEVRSLAQRIYTLANAPKIGALLTSPNGAPEAAA
jgi:2-methylcitrate dehydratase PrpD